MHTGLTPCEIPPTADIKCWQARRDRGQKCRQARHDRGQFGGEPAVTVVKMVPSPPRAWSLMSISRLPTSPSNIKGWRARCGRGQKCRRARRRTVCLFKLCGLQQLPFLKFAVTSVSDPASPAGSPAFLTTPVAGLPTFYVGGGGRQVGYRHTVSDRAHGGLATILTVVMAGAPPI